MKPRLVCCGSDFHFGSKGGGRERVWVGKAVRIWLFRKSEPKWEALLPTPWFSGWEISKLSYCLMLMFLHAGAGMRGGSGFEATD